MHSSTGIFEGILGIPRKQYIEMQTAHQSKSIVLWLAITLIRREQVDQWKKNMPMMVQSSTSFICCEKDVDGKIWVFPERKTWAPELFGAHQADYFDFTLMRKFFRIFSNRLVIFTRFVFFFSFAKVMFLRLYDCLKLLALNRKSYVTHS